MKQIVIHNANDRKIETGRAKKKSYFQMIV
jgi:hypothetical protein